MTPRPEDALLELYDQALARHGDTAMGALWPNEADRQRRYDVMLDLLADAPAGGRVLLCDLGCGTGGLLERIRARGLHHVQYRGLDRSAQAIALARAKFPGAEFHQADVLAKDADPALLDCDYLVANGLFTVRGVLSHAQMRAFLEAVVTTAWPRVRRGLAFNVMSTAVELEREDLFHSPMDDMARLLHALAGRRVRMRADYGLYEYTCFAWREGASATAAAMPQTPAPDAPIPVLRPRLPDADRVLPYLRRIDAARVYSNFGPLVLEFEQRLAGLLDVPGEGLVSASTGTAGLVACVLALAGRATPARNLALMPAYTFVATAVAAQECGYEPLLADVRADDWQLDPVALAAHPRLHQVGVAMPVAPYGRLVDPAPWLEFEARTGIPVVIDGAASLEPASHASRGAFSEIPVVFSLHATKGLATGEGGAVACTDASRIARIGQALNFGFSGSRESRAPSTNGKMSEYHAAVGLAELDGWPQKSAALRVVADRYRRQAIDAGLDERVFTAPQLCSSYVLFDAGDAHTGERVRAALDRGGIGHRLWYGLGLHHQPSFADYPADALPVTDALAPRLVGLPMAPDLDAAAIARVVAALREACSDEDTAKKRRAELEGESCVLGNLYSRNFCHWISEELVKVVLLERSGFDGRYVLSSLPGFAHEFLALLRIPHSRIVVADGPLRLRSAWFTTAITARRLHRFLGLFHAVREALLRDVQPRPGSPRRIWMDRVAGVNNPGRELLNPDEVYPLLARYGFEVLDMAARPVAEQLALAHGAEALSGPHGAGFIHALFMQPRSAVVECFSPLFINPGIFEICRLLRHRYQMVAYENCYDGYPHGNRLMVDVSQLELALQALD